MEVISFLDSILGNHGLRKEMSICGIVRSVLTTSPSWLSISQLVIGTAGFVLLRGVLFLAC